VTPLIKIGEDSRSVEINPWSREQSDGTTTVTKSIWSIGSSVGRRCVCRLPSTTARIVGTSTPPFARTVASRQSAGAPPVGAAASPPLPPVALLPPPGLHPVHHVRKYRGCGLGDTAVAADVGANGAPPLRYPAHPALPSASPTLGGKSAVRSATGLVAATGGAFLYFSRGASKWQMRVRPRLGRRRRLGDRVTGTAAHLVRATQRENGARGVSLADTWALASGFSRPAGDPGRRVPLRGRRLPSPLDR